MNTITSHQITRLADHRVKVAAQINLNNRTHQVSFIVTGSPVYRGIEPFLTLALLPAMTLREPIELDQPVSPRLLANLETLQEIFVNWHEQFHKVAVKVPAQRSKAAGHLPARISSGLAAARRLLAARLNRALSGKSEKKPGHSLPPDSKVQGHRKVGCLFSGGVDSFYTLIKHFDEIDTLIFVSGGFDIYPHPNNIELRRMISGRLRRLAASTGKEFIEVEAHILNYSDNYVHWFWYHGAAMAAVAQLFTNRFHKIFLASSGAYNNLFPCGSHLITDPLWSTDELELVYDGCEANRLQKIGAIASSEMALKYLRVCLNYGENREYNCGECEKCVRTMAILRAHQALDRCPVFARPLDLEAISRLSLKQPYTRAWQEILEKLEETGQDLEFIRVIKQALSNAYEDIGREKIKVLEKQIADYAPLFTSQRAWAAGLAENNGELTRQLVAANQWGHNLEIELQKLKRTR